MIKSVDGVSRRTENVAQQTLCNSHIHELRTLRVEQVDQALLISGKVTTFYYKQLAQEALRSVASGLQVVNDVSVEPVEDFDPVF